MKEFAGDFIIYILLAYPTTKILLFDAVNVELWTRLVP